MKLSVEGYKSIGQKCEITFDGLTVLAGANSSGKSSFMQPFLVLKQTLENHYDSETLLLDGANIRFTDSSQLISRVPEYQKKYFGICMSQSKRSCEVRYRYKRGKGLVPDTVILKDDKNYDKGLSLKVGMKSDDIKKQVSSENFDIIYEFYKQQKQKPVWSVQRDKCFIRAELGMKGKKQPSPLVGGIDPARDIKKMVTRLIHVPGLRGNPERTYKIVASEKIHQGSFEQYVATIVNDWSRLKKFESKFLELKKQFKELGLANKIETAKVNETRLEINVSRNATEDNSDCVNISDVGFGVSQILPVLIALLCAKKEQYVYIEQPELHLHPKAQFKMAKIITQAVNRGVKVIIETHSSVLLRGIQIEIVQSNLDYKKVSLNWFTQNPENGATIVSTAALDELASFGDWPEDFDDINLMVERTYLDAVEESLNER